jgi:serine/threonine protein phosphatase PrpC
MNHTDRRHLEVAIFTHPGLSGRNNEDRYAVESYAGPAKRPVLLAVLCDGIGGHRGGEVAAELAVDHIVRSVADSDGTDPLGILETAIQGASRAIAARASGNPDEAGMGATCACIWIAGDRLFTAHVGDSRLYLVQDGKIHRLTVDHTWVQEAIEVGLIAPEQAGDHPNVHVLRRYLGSPKPPVVDFRQFLDADQNGGQARRSQGAKLKPGDIVMACTDGLTDCVPEHEILRLVAKHETLESAAEDLVMQANERGGHDNTTVVLVRASFADEAGRRRTRRSREGSPAA